jgi:hypothetical protein
MRVLVMKVSDRVALACSVFASLQNWQRLRARRANVQHVVLHRRQVDNQQPDAKYKCVIVFCEYVIDSVEL